MNTTLEELCAKLVVQPKSDNSVAYIKDWAQRLHQDLTKVSQASIERSSSCAILEQCQVDHANKFACAESDPGMLTAFHQTSSKDIFAKSAKQQLDEYIAAAHEVSLKIANVQTRNDSLRALIDEMFREAEKWRKESQEPWASQICDLLFQVQNTASCSEMFSAEGVDRPSSKDLQPHTALQVCESQQRALLTEQEQHVETALHLEIQKLREENQRLSGILRAKAKKPNRSNSRQACKGSSASVAQVSAAKRRVLDCARKTQFLEQGNAKLRKQIGEMETYQRSLEEQLVKHNKNVSTFCQPPHQDRVRALSVSAAARRLQAQSAKHVAKSSASFSNKTQKMMSRKYSGQCPPCQSKSMGCSGAADPSFAESVQEGIPNESISENLFDISSIERFTSEVEASMCRSSSAPPGCRYPTDHK